MIRYTLAILVLLSLGRVSASHAGIFLAQGCMSGEVSDTSVLLQTRLTKTPGLDADKDVPGSPGKVRFQWAADKNFSDAKETHWQDTSPDRDFIVRFRLNDLSPGKRYFYRAQFGVSADDCATGPRCSFKTLPGESSDSVTRFVMTSCMNYNTSLSGFRQEADSFFG